LFPRQVAQISPRQPSKASSAASVWVQANGHFQNLLNTLDSGLTSIRCDDLLDIDVNQLSNRLSASTIKVTKLQQPPYGDFFNFGSDKSYYFLFNSADNNDNHFCIIASGNRIIGCGLMLSCQANTTTVQDVLQKYYGYDTPPALAQTLSDQNDGMSGAATYVWDFSNCRLKILAEPRYSSDSFLNSIAVT